MLSSSSFNALLKTLEEPPPHVKFLLATTDPQKLPITVLSRCLQFNLKNLSPQRIVEHLHYVLTEEQMSFDEPALWLLARSADGSMRDALSLTDQAIAFGSGSVNEADVRTMLGTIDQQLVYQILTSLAQRNAAEVIRTVQTLSEFSPDYTSVLADLISLLHRVALAQVLPNAIDNSLGDLQQVMQLAQLLTPEDVQLFYQIGLMGRKDLPFAPDLREGLEMVLLRMLAFRPVELSPPSSIESPLIPLPKINTTTPQTPDEPNDSSVPEHPPALEETQTLAVNVKPEPPHLDDVPPWEELPPSLEVSSSDSPSVVNVNSSDSSETETELLLPKKSEAAESSPAAVGRLNQKDWVTQANELPLTGMTASICRNLSLERVDVSQLVFHYTPEQGALMNDTQQVRIKEALEQFVGSNLEIVFVQAEQSRETPAQYSLRKKVERQAEAVVSMQKDPHVQRIIEEFSAELVIDSVRPID